MAEEERARLDEQARARLGASLAHHRPFALLGAAERAWLLERVRLARHAPGAVVIAAGAHADRLHLVCAGAAGLRAAGGEEELAEVVEGRFFPLEELHLQRPVLFEYRARGELWCAELELPQLRALQATSPAFRESCERRARRFFARLGELEGAASEVSSVRSGASGGGERAGAEELAHVVRRARDPAVLARAVLTVRELSERWRAEGLAPARLTRLVWALCDRVAGRVLELELERAALDGARFCWLALGSDGRMEQEPGAGQENAIVFTERSPGAAEEARRRLLPLAARIREVLAACGFPRRPGAPAAADRRWCLDAVEWRDRLEGWLGDPEPAALAETLAALDLRPAYGDLSVGAELRAWLGRRAPGAPLLASLGAAALEVAPPLDLFGRLRPARRGALAGTLDLDREAARLFVDAGRVLALATGAGGPGTEQRLREGGARAGASPGEVEGWIDAFHRVQALRIGLRTGRSRAGLGEAEGDRIDPLRLEEEERRLLVEALRRARDLRRWVARVARGGGR